jgi:hypothetical protein
MGVPTQRPPILLYSVKFESVDALRNRFGNTKSPGWGG